MTLIEAIKSGQPFRHKRTGFLYGPMLPSWDNVRWSHEDVLLDVWEIEEKKVEITETQAEFAFETVKRYFDCYNPRIDRPALAGFKRALGFK